MSKGKLRILFVRPFMGHGGADRITLNILQGFDREKYDCELLLMKISGELIGDIPPDINVIETNSATPILMYRSIKRLVHSGRYDVVYSTSGGTNIPVALASSSAKVITVLSERTALFAPGKNKLKQSIFHVLKRLTYNRANYVTAVSHGLSQQLENYIKVQPYKLHVVNNPIVNTALQVSRQEPVEHPAFNKGEPVILAVGRLIPLKDFSTLVNAFNIVNKEMPAQLLILGKGPLEHVLREQAKNIGLDDRIHFAGYDKNPFRYMKRCDMFVLSSRHEGMPGVLIQAMACGAPCVSTDCPTGPSEIITHGINGLLAQMGNAEDIAQCIVRLLRDRELRDTIAKNGKESVSIFEEQQAIDSYFSFINPQE